MADSFDLTAGKHNQHIGDYFTRPEKTIRGDIAQALMQNCMVGVHGYETNTSGTDCLCNGESMGTGATFSLDMEYPEVNIYGSNAHINPGGSYVENTININVSNYYVQWTPLMNTAATQTLMSGPDMVACLSTDLSASSQTVPFYTWVMESTGFGGEKNDWKSSTGPYRDNPGTSWDVTHNLSGTPEYPNKGDYQNNMGEFPAQFTPPDGLPLLTRTSSKSVNFSRPMFYYFGLRPGKTAFNIFVTKYIDEDFSETVI